MERYINAEKVKRNIRVNLMPNVDVDGTVTVENAERYFLNLIDKTSTADVAEVKHGEWLMKHLGAGSFWECSECKFKNCVMPRTNYCPECGAKMDE